MANQEIENIRKQIDELDKKIVELLNERAHLSLKVNEFKLQENLPLYDPAREEEILDEVSKLSNSTLPADYVKKIYNVILDCMKDVVK
ncbi:MAG: chorismate mutase [Actinobacteria bacterium]|nr:MAG: chorismate mutase [Actinomycetota bacterium]